MINREYPNLEEYLAEPDKQDYPQICSWLGTVALTHEPEPYTVEKFEQAVRFFVASYLKQGM